MKTLPVSCECVAGRLGSYGQPGREGGGELSKKFAVFTEHSLDVCPSILDLPSQLYLTSTCCAH